MNGERAKAGIFRITTDSPDQTLRLGRILGEILPRGFFVALVGSLGAGKTLLTRGIARGLGVEDEGEVSSPTFVLVNEYRGRFPVYHIDLYRLERFAEAEAIGWDELVYGPGVAVVEWADKVEEELPAERVQVFLEWAGEQRRDLVFEGIGPRGRALVEELKEKWGKEE